MAHEPVWVEAGQSGEQTAVKESLWWFATGLWGQNHQWCIDDEPAGSNLSHAREGA